MLLGRETRPNPYTAKTAYAKSREDLTRKHGADAVSRAKKIVQQYGSEGEKRLLATRMGNDFETVDRVLQFGDQAEKEYRRNEESLTTATAGILYGDSMVKPQTAKVVEGLTEKFRNMVNIDAKNSFIAREGDPENMY